ncbi:MAG: DUF2516 family protein, partial [Micromonosporaceae bacterium]
MIDHLAVDFAGPIVSWVQIGLFIFAVIIEVVAFIHCLLQRPDAFRAVGTLSKGIWLALTGGAVFLSLLVLSSPTGILGLIGITAAAVYLLDVRPAVRDASGGSGG